MPVGTIVKNPEHDVAAIVAIKKRNRM